MERLVLRLRTDKQTEGYAEKYAPFNNTHRGKTT
jgi:hypothetical protein